VVGRLQRWWWRERRRLRRGPGGQKILEKSMRVGSYKKRTIYGMVLGKSPKEGAQRGGHVHRLGGIAREGRGGIE
jgi:hypothetical protein